MPSDTGPPCPHAGDTTSGTSSIVPRPAATLSAFARRLRLAREAQGLSQVELAELAGLEPRTLRRIEAARCWPRLDTCLRLCDALRTPLSTLVDPSSAPFQSRRIRHAALGALVASIPSQTARSLARLFTTVSRLDETPRREPARKPARQKRGRP